MQIASEKKVFIFDLIKLYEYERHDLDECLKLVFHSSEILKLGMRKKNCKHVYLKWN